MKLVVVESPYAGDVEANVAYARRCVLDCLRRGESPYASHLFFTQPGILDDLIPAERDLAILAGLAWGLAADLVAVYIDRGVSKGMMQGILTHRRARKEIVCRSIEHPHARVTSRPVFFHLPSGTYSVDVDPLECLCICSKHDPPTACVLHQSIDGVDEPQTPRRRFCQYCEKPMAAVGFFGSAPVQLCTAHLTEHGADFDRIDTSGFHPDDQKRRPR